VENLAIDNSMYVVSINKTRDQINYDKLLAFAPIMNIDAVKHSLPAIRGKRKRTERLGSLTKRYRSADKAQ
jgi:hypothetical protein